MLGNVTSINSRIVIISFILFSFITTIFTANAFSDEMTGMAMHKHEHHDLTMHGFYGPYPMTRESSGTSWQPDSSPFEGVHVMVDEWMFMMHGYCNAIYDTQGGPRGDEMFFSTNMLMFMMQHPFLNGIFGMKGMASLEPTIGRDGYPLLFQTGETADGVTHLVDRQHPHDLMMELAATYSLPLSSDSSVFIYFGTPGEPALGPPVFMERFSGEYIPDAPITHHWLDSTHITYGVITFGCIKSGIKVENSFFRGREPDQFRWNIETPQFDSYSMRATINPTKDISLQVSYGHLDSPEQLSPNIDVDRLTASITYNKPFHKGNWQTTIAYGENWNIPGHALPAYLAESAVNFCDKHIVFGRAELVYKDELFEEGSPLEGRTFPVGKAEAGCLYNFIKTNNISLGVGYSASLVFYSDELDGYYGDAPWSNMLFARIEV